MTQNPYSPQDQQPPSHQQVQPPPPPQQPQGFPGRPMNVYPSPGAYGGVYPGQQPRPPWPTVVGIISLCVAGIFGLMTIGSLIYNASGFHTAQQREVLENMPGWFRPYKWVGGVFTIATYVVLAIGGAKLLKRRRAGRTLHVAFALMGVLVAISGLVVMITMMNYMSPPANMPPQARVAFKATMAFSAIIGMAFALAYPVFVLIWFTRPKVNQHIRTWQS
jgi:hypothetical protein